MNTTALEPTRDRRRRRKHSAEFKAQAVAACREPGVSIAAMALANGINANLLRRWVVDAEQPSQSHAPSVVPIANATPSFIPVSMPAATCPPDIRIELHRGATLINVTWPVTAAVECAAWMRELLR